MYLTLINPSSTPELWFKTELHRALDTSRVGVEKGKEMKAAFSFSSVPL